MARIKSDIKIKSLKKDGGDDKSDAAPKKKKERGSGGKKLDLSKDLSLKDLKNIGGSIRSKASRGSGKMPTKTSINLAALDEKKPVSRQFILGLVAVILIFMVLGKFFVFDKLIDMFQGTSRVTELQMQIDEAYRTINEKSDIEDTYAHYTYSGMTQEELALVDRVDIMRMAEEAILKGDTTRQWTLSGNTMTLQVSGTSLQELNQLAQALERNDIVERCVINTANKNEKLETRRDVAVTFVIYLQQPPETVDILEEQANMQGGDQQ